MKRVLGYFLILFIISSCTTQKGLKKYYYPFKNLNNSKVYKYVDRNTKKNIEYWKVISIPKRNELKTVSYNSEFKIFNTFDEIITKTGAILKNYSDYEENVSGILTPKLKKMFSNGMGIKPIVIRLSTKTNMVGLT